MIYRNISNPLKNNAIEKEYKKLWERLDKKPSVLFLRSMCSINSVESNLYVPENIHYGIIEPILNNKSYSLLFNDKNFFERYLYKHKALFPATILRGINGVFYDNDFKLMKELEILSSLQKLEENENFILKPATETGGGTDVMLVVKSADNFNVSDKVLNANKFLSLLRTKYRGSFVIQKKIQQLSWFNEFNTSSVNTVRLYTYRSVTDEQVHPFHAYVRFGKVGSLVDSSAKGGFTCGINREGILNKFALGKYGQIYSELDCIKKNGGMQVPFFNDMKRIAIEIASSFHYHRLLGFDFCVEHNNKIRLFEINTHKIGIINQQMNNGPLFGEFTEEVINYCNEKQKSIVLDFYV